LWIDPWGLDAIWLQYDEAGAGFGHTSLLIQDENGDWWFFYFGAEGGTSKYIDNPFLIFDDVASFVQCYKIGSAKDGLTDKDSVLKFMNANESKMPKNKDGKTALDPRNELSGMIYFEGDFTKSLSAADNMREDYTNGKGMKYNLLFNNCMQVSADLLSKGKFAHDDFGYKLALAQASTLILPNIAFTGMSYTNEYYNSPWYAQIIFPSPHMALAAQQASIAATLALSPMAIINTALYNKKVTKKIGS